MIVAAVLNGFSASSRPTRTHDVVHQVLVERGLPFLLKGWRSSFFWGRSRAVSKFIQSHESVENDLLLVGKSLGATHMIERVLNPLVAPLRYCTVSCLFIDPCWPTWGDWTPNLNGKVLHLTRRVDRAVNVYVVAKEKRQQAGALVEGPTGTKVENIPVVDADHFSIIGHDIVREKLKELL